MTDNTQDVEFLRNNLDSLSRMVSTLNSASSSLIGRGAQALMYQTGKDLGKKEGAGFDHTDDLEKAVRMIIDHEKQVFDIEVWKDEGQTEVFSQDGDIRSARLLFRECPIRQVCLTYGVPMDDSICRISSGMIAGMLGDIMQKKVDVSVLHAGPNSCLKKVSIKE